jgi:hypothetical protein
MYGPSMHARNAAKANGYPKVPHERVTKNRGIRRAIQKFALGQQTSWSCLDELIARRRTTARARSAAARGCDIAEIRVSIEQCDAVNRDLELSWRSEQAKSEHSSPDAW